MQTQRVITAVICIPLLLLLLWLGGWWLALALAALTAVGGLEYARLVRVMARPDAAVWYAAGWLYLVGCFVCFFFGRQLGGFSGALWLLVVIWSTDTAAYEVGRRIGKHKLAPTVSPNKTVEGAVAGIIAAFVIGGGYALLIMDINWISILAVPILISAIGQLGDLLESRIKRLAGVKDSGRLFPGHGGVLDRFDSIMLSSPFMCLFLLIIY